MASTIKFTLENNVFAYIADENGANPFIYNGSTGKRTYRESSVVSAPNASVIQEYVDNNLNSESLYRNAYNAMVSLISEKGYSTDGFGDYSTAFNVDDSACITRAAGGNGCPELYVTSRSLPCGSEPTVRQTDHYQKPDGTHVYHYEFGIPNSCDGPQGDKGDRGPGGNIGPQGDLGAQGSVGSQGERGVQGVDAVAQYTSFIFTKSNLLEDETAKVNAKNALDAAQPCVEGGENVYYNDPMIGIAGATLAGVKWYDTIPYSDKYERDPGNSVTDKGNVDALVWMSKKIFSTDDQLWCTYKWTKPVCVADSEYMDYEWNTGYTATTLEEMQRSYKPQRTSPDDDNPGTTYVDGHDPLGWYDNPVSGAVWMAVRKISNGVYEGEWEISKIKGEQGDAGVPLTFGEQWAGDDFYKEDCNDPDAGTYIGTKMAGQSEKEGGPVREKDGYGAQINEAHVCSEDSTFSCGDFEFKKGHLYVWDGDTWEDIGLFNGEGDFLHIKYANLRTDIPDGSDISQIVDGACFINYLDSWIEWTDESGETPNGDFVGLCHTKEEEDPFYKPGVEGLDDMVEVYRMYKWSQSKGEDGWGYEYIYCAMPNEEVPDAPKGGDSFFIGAQSFTKRWSFEGDYSKDYQSNFDFMPGEVTVGGSVIPNIRWHDNYMSPSEEFPFVYECYRRRNPNGVWTEFFGDASTANPQKAALKSMFAQSPDYASTIFKRSNEMFGDDAKICAEWRTLINACSGETGGTYDDPVPSVPEGWSDGIPYGDGVLWLCRRRFSKSKSKRNPAAVGNYNNVTNIETFRSIYNNEPLQPYLWGEPVIAADTEDVDREWNTDERYADVYDWQDMPIPTRTSPSDKYPFGEPAPSPLPPFNPDYYGWWDNPQNDSIWLAECRIIGGKYETITVNNVERPNWKLTRIKGENGKDGDNALIADLTNEMDGLALGDDYILDVETATTTVAYIMSGTTKVRPTNVIVTPPAGFSNDNITTTNLPEGIEIRITLPIGTNFEGGGHRKQFAVAVSYEGRYSKTITYTIVGIRAGKDGEIFRLATSVDYVAFYPDGDKSAEYVRCSAYLGSVNLIEASGDSYEIRYTVSDVPLDTYDGETMIPYPGGDGVPVGDVTEKGLIFYLIKKDESPKLILDRESIPYVKNGRDGAGLGVLRLRNDRDSIGLGGNHILGDDDPRTDKTEYTFITTMALYSGTTELIISGTQGDVNLGVKVYPVNEEGKEDKDHEYAGDYKYKSEQGGTTNDPIDVDTVIDNVIGSETYHKKCTATITIPRGFKFNEDLKYQFYFEATGKNEDGEVLTMGAIFQIIGLLNGKDGSSYQLYPSVGSIKWDKNLKTQVPSTISCLAYNGGELVDTDVASSSMEAFILMNYSDSVHPDNIIEEQDHITWGDDWVVFENSGSTAPTRNLNGCVFYLLSGTTKTSDGKIVPDEIYTVLDCEPVEFVSDGIDGAGSVITNLSNDTSVISLGKNWTLDTLTTKHTILTVSSGDTLLNIKKIKINNVEFVEGVSSDPIIHVVNGITVKAYFRDPTTTTHEVYLEFVVPVGYDFKDDRTVEFTIIPMDEQQDHSWLNLPSALFELNGVKGGEDGAEFEVIPSMDFITYHSGDKTFDNEDSRGLDVTCTLFYNNTDLYDLIDAEKYISEAKVFYSVGVTYSDYDTILSSSASTNPHNVADTGKCYKIWDSATASDNLASIDNLDLFKRTVGGSVKTFRDAPTYVVFYLIAKFIGEDDWIMPFGDRETLPLQKDGKDGAGYAVMDLDNEIEPIGVGGNEILEIDMVGTCGTKLKMYHGVDELIISSITVTTTNEYDQSDSLYNQGTSRLVDAGKIRINNPTIDVSGKEGTVSIDLFGASGSTFEGIYFKGKTERRKFAITAIGYDASGTYEITKNYIMIGVKEGEDGASFKLIPTRDQIKVYYNNGDRDIEPNSIGCKMYSITEEGAKELTSANTFVSFDNVYNTPQELEDNFSENFKEHWINNTTIKKVMKLSDTNLPKYLTTENIDLVDDNANPIVYLVSSSITFYYVRYEEVGGNINILSIIDRETVPVLRDGRDGAGSIRIDLDNENDTIGVGEDHIFLNETEPGAANSHTFTTVVAMYSGTTALTLDNVEAEVESPDSGVKATLTGATTQGVQGSIASSAQGPQAMITLNWKDRTGASTSGGRKQARMDIEMPAGFTFNDALHYNVRISATAGTEAKSAQYSLTGLLHGKDGSAYMMVPNPPRIFFNGDRLIKIEGANGTVLTAETSINVTAWLGNEQLFGGTVPDSQDPAKYRICYEITHSNVNNKKRSGLEYAEWDSATSSWTLTITNQNASDEQCILYLEAPNTSVGEEFVDFETIPFNFDGENARTFQLTSYYGSVPTGADGILNTTIPYPVEVTAFVKGGENEGYKTITGISVADSAGTPHSLTIGAQTDTAIYSVAGTDGWTISARAARDNDTSGVTVTFKFSDKVNFNASPASNDKFYFKILASSETESHMADYYVGADRNAKDPSYITISQDSFNVPTNNSGVYTGATFTATTILVQFIKEGVDTKFNGTMPKLLLNNDDFKPNDEEVYVDTVTASTTFENGICTGEVDIIVPSGCSFDSSGKLFRFSTSDGNVSYYKDFILYGSPEGKDGKSGKMLYPAGEWSGSERYCEKETTTPYVHHSATWDTTCGGDGTETYEYWYLDTEGCNDPDGCVGSECEPGTCCCWKPMENFNAIYTDILIAKFGKVGEIIFYDNFMFSRYGQWNFKALNGSASYDRVKAMDGQSIYDATGVQNWSLALATSDSATRGGDGPGNYRVNSGKTYYALNGKYQTNYEEFISGESVWMSRNVDTYINSSAWTTSKAYYYGQDAGTVNLRVIKNNVCLSAEREDDYTHFLRDITTKASVTADGTLMSRNSTVPQILSNSEFIPNFFVNLYSGELYSADATLYNSTLYNASIEEAQITDATIKNANIENSKTVNGTFESAIITGSIRTPYYYITDCSSDYISEIGTCYYADYEYLIGSLGSVLNLVMPLYLNGDINGATFHIIVPPPRGNTVSKVIVYPYRNSQTTSNTLFKNYATNVYYEATYIELSGGYYNITAIGEEGWAITNMTGSIDLHTRQGELITIAPVFGENLTNIVSYTSSKPDMGRFNNTTLFVLNPTES